MGNISTSDFIHDGFEGVAEQFTEITIVRKTSHNVLARAKRYGKWWMLKGLLPEEADQPVFQEMLRKEFDLMHKLKHASIIDTNSLERVEGLGMCIVMEWYDAMTLDEYLQQRKPTKRECRKLLKLLLEAVAYMHRQGVVHRDLKPQNILVTRNGTNLKLIDFGLADNDSFAVLKQPSGTPEYMSPEQAHGGAPDVRNDIYSLGIILKQTRLGGGILYRRVIHRCTLPIERRYRNIEEMEAAMRSAERQRLVMWVVAVVAVVAAGIVAVQGILTLINRPHIPDFITDISQLSNTKQYMVHTRGKFPGTLGVSERQCATTLENNRPHIPDFITDISQLSNTKQYMVHTRGKFPGTLGVSERQCATTLENSQVHHCEEPSPFAIIKYEGSYYLYSIADKRFINMGMQETDAPRSNEMCALNIFRHDSCAFVIEYKGSHRYSRSTLNTGLTYGLFPLANGAQPNIYTDCNLFYFEEAGDFDPTEAIAMLKEPNPEYAAARKVLTEGRYRIYTQTDATGKEGATHYYIKADGTLSTTMSDSCIFTIRPEKGVERPQKLPCYRQDVWAVLYQEPKHPNDSLHASCFRGPNKYDGDYSPCMGYILPISYRVTYETHQVFFLGENGRYAVRSSNEPWEWFAGGTFWNVFDLNGDGMPEIDCGRKRAYIWQIERVKM